MQIGCNKKTGQLKILYANKEKLCMIKKVTLCQKIYLKFCIFYEG
jgi:hypothetical protein